MSERSFSRRYLEATGLRRAGGGPAAGGGGAPASLGHQGPHQAYRAAMWLRNGGDDAAQLPASAVDEPTGLSSALQYLADRAVRRRRWIYRRTAIGAAFYVRFRDGIQIGGLVAELS